MQSDLYQEGSAVREALLSWFEREKRDLPWRRNKTPYRVWISEIMLQQTRVEAVKGYFTRFLEALPTVYDLASVPDEVLMKLWQGLGYYSRARNLKKGAMRIVSDFGGELPHTEKELLSIPGIGPYTAGAILSIAYDLPFPAVDGNVERVLSRLLADLRDGKDPKTRESYRELVRALMPLPREGCSNLTEGLIELGATVCLPNGEPKCDICPLSPYCKAKEEGDPTSYPVKMPKKARRIEEHTILLVQREGRFALSRRREGGLLAGLYEPLNFDTHLNEAEVEQAVKALALSPTSILPLPPATHIFTHIEWRMIGYLVSATGEGKGSFTFFTPNEILEECAVPSAFRQYMKTVYDRFGKETEK